MFGRRRKKEKEIIERHKALGYTAFNKNEQLYMVVNQDFSKIVQLIPEFKKEPLPFDVIKNYINVNEDDVFEYLFKTNYIGLNHNQYLHKPSSDGIWITSNESLFGLILQDRGKITKEWSFSNKDELLKFLAKQFMKFTFPSTCTSFIVR